MPPIIAMAAMTAPRTAWFPIASATEFATCVDRSSVAADAEKFTTANGETIHPIAPIRAIAAAISPERVVANACPSHAFEISSECFWGFAIATYAPIAIVQHAVAVVMATSMATFTTAATYKPLNQFRYAPAATAALHTPWSSQSNIERFAPNANRSRPKRRRAS